MHYNYYALASFQLSNDSSSSCSHHELYMNVHLQYLTVKNRSHISNNHRSPRGILMSSLGINVYSCLRNSSPADDLVALAVAAAVYFCSYHPSPVTTMCRESDNGQRKNSSAPPITLNKHCFNPIYHLDQCILPCKINLESS